MSAVPALGDVSPTGLDRRLVAPGPAWRLALLHLTLLVAIGVRLATRPWWSLGERVPDMFEPVPVLAWLDAPPARGVVLAVWLVGLAAVLAGAWRVLRHGSGRLLLAVAWLSHLVLAGLWGSGGKVLHNDLLLLTVTVPVLLGPSIARARRGDEDAGDEASDESAAGRVGWGWPPRAALAVLGTVYFLTGFQKLRHSGLDWVMSENLRWVLRQGSPHVPDGTVQALADQLWLTQLLAAGALAVELAAPLLLVVRRTRVLFAVSATALHGSIWLAVGIDYWAWVMAVWAIVLPSTGAGARLAGALGLRTDEIDRAGTRDHEVTPA